MKFSTKLAVAVPGALLAGVVAASPAFATDTPPMSPSPMSPSPMSSTVAGGDQLSGFGHTHLGSGSGHSIGNISHSIIVMTGPPYCPPPSYPIEVDGNWTCSSS